MLRLLVKRHRDTAAQLRAKQIVRVSALLTELHPGGLRSKATPTKAAELLASVAGTDEVTRCRVLIARELLGDIALLDDTLKASKQRIAAAVEASATTLWDIVGIGPICAATIIGCSAGDVTRFASKHGYATYNATAPLETSSGGRTRHRLNPRGNRTLNFAIHIAAVVQIRNPGEGRAFYDRKISEGKTNKGSDPRVETTYIGPRLHAPRR